VSNEMRSTRGRVVSAGLLAALALAALIALAGCGGGSSSSGTTASTEAESTEGESSSGSSGAEPTGAPILVGMIGTEGTATHNAPDYVAAVEAGATTVNEEGGLGGHPVKVTFCNDSADPNKAEACARQMVSEKVTATIADLSEGNSIAVAEILDKANIPQLGVVANSEFEFNCHTCFPFDANQQGANVGLIQSVKNEGGKKVYAVNLNVPIGEFQQAPIKPAAEKLGVEMVGETLIDFETADYAPIAAKIVQSGAEWTLLGVSETNALQLVKALTQLGYQGNYLLSTGVLTAADYKTLGASVEGALVFGGTPPFSAAETIPTVGTFLEEITAEYEAGNEAANPESVTLLGEQAWVVFKGWEQLAKAAEGEVTAASILAGIESGTTIDTKGMSDEWTPGKSAGIPALPQVSNPTGWFMKVEGSELALVEESPFNVGSLLK
jgi:ABC-type branched-subunit amino acid transport system substrate-binding protein